MLEKQRGKKHKCVGRDMLIYNAQTPKARDAGVLAPLYPSRRVWFLGLLAQKQKDFRWSTTGSPRDGIGCSFKLSNFFWKRITSKIKSVPKVFFFVDFRME
jgi:hypothetical protein